MSRGLGDVYKRQTFTRVAAELEAGLEYKVIKHILNSAGIERFTDYQMDMVRLGIGLYGVSASGQKGLRNISTLKTTILQIQNVPAGDSIGYSRMSYVKRDSRIAIIPIGYADGLSRTLSNRMDVLYRGERVRQVGNICMDQFMVAIQSNPAHEIPEAEYGDEMIIVGRDGDAEITMDEMARLRGTINYEVACGFGMRLDKVYV